MLIKTHLVSESQLDTDEAAERSTAALVQQARANVESARINLGYTDVTSPIAGIAGEQQVTEGAMVGQGTPTLLATVESRLGGCMHNPRTSPSLALPSLPLCRGSRSTASTS